MNEGKYLIECTNPLNFPEFPKDIMVFLTIIELTLLFMYLTLAIFKLRNNNLGLSSSTHYMSWKSFYHSRAHLVNSSLHLLKPRYHHRGFSKRVLGLVTREDFYHLTFLKVSQNTSKITTLAFTPFLWKIVWGIWMVPIIQKGPKK